MGALDRAVQAALDAWRPPPRMLVSEWAERYRHLSPEASAEHGPWSNAKAPHLVAPMDALSPYHPAERVVCKFSSQTGKTEIILNFIGYCIDLDPGPILAIQPNVSPMGEAFSKDRIAPMLRDSPTLKAKIAKSKARSSANTIAHKTFPGGHLTVAGANSPAGLASRPIRFLVCDEISRWEATKEGDPLLLARKRLQTYRAHRSAKELIVSSPSYADIGISPEYEKCDQKWLWKLACLHCGEYQFPKLKHFMHDGKNAKELRYVCQHCGAEHSLEDEDTVKGTGRWDCIEDFGQDSVGFYMNQWASPFARWDDTLEEWLAAGEDPLQKQAIINTAFAEDWEGEGEKTDPQSLEGRAEDYDAEVPHGVEFLTAGADVQQDRIEIEIVGWNSAEQSWSIDYQILPGEPTGEDVWNDFAELLARTYTDAKGRKHGIALTCVDSSYWSKNVYAFVAVKRDRRIVPVKGGSVFGADVVSGSLSDRRKRAAKRLVNGKPPEILGVSQIKVILAQYFNAGPDKQGYCHFPTGRPAEYYGQLTGERLIVEKKRGKRPQYVWARVASNVEALDCRVYAYGAMQLLERKKFVRSSPKKTDPEKPKAARRPVRPNRGNFVNRWR